MRAVATAREAVDGDGIRKAGGSGLGKGCAMQDSDDRGTSGSESSAERRGQRRIELEPGALRIQTGSLAAFLDEYALNISSGGFFLATRRTLPVGTRFSFSFELGPEDLPLRGVAEVRWLREAAREGGPGGMGVAFVELDDETRRIVNQIVATQRLELGGSTS